MSNMMTHDPLCLCASRECVPDTCIKCAYCQCECETIREVRADEREKAAQRIAAICGHTHNVACRDCQHDECIAAARGEEP